LATVIAIVVSAGHEASFELAAAALSGVSFRWIRYGAENEIRDRMRDLLASTTVDGALMGPMPYDRCRHVLPNGFPVSVVRAGAIDLALTYSRALARGWKQAPVSIDTLDADAVKEISSSLGLDLDQIGCLPYRSDQSTDQIIDFHRSFLERTGEGYVITGRTEVAQRLTGELRVLRTLAVPSTVRAALNELVLRVQSRRDSGLRFAAGVFSVVASDSAHNLERSRAGLMHTLLETPEFADAWVEDRARRGVVVFAHKALLEQVTGGWVSVPIIATAEARLGVKLAAGFGLGSTARRCVLLAEQAAARAEQEGGGCAYLIDDSGVMVGPMGREATPLEFTYREHGRRLEGLATRVGLSPATLSRLAAIDRKVGDRPVSPAELAEAMGITDPSGRRLIRALTAQGLATPAGSAQASRKGRPTRLYRLRVEERVSKRRRES
jgi:MarR family